MTPPASVRAVQPHGSGRKRSERQAESGGLSGLDRLRKHQERREGGGEGSGEGWQEAAALRGRKPLAMIGQVAQRESAPTGEDVGWKRKESCSCIEQQLSSIIKLED